MVCLEADTPGSVRVVRSESRSGGAYRPCAQLQVAARLQKSQAADGPPVLIRIETSAGHGAGTALTKVMDETADSLAFLTQVLGM